MDFGRIFSLGEADPITETAKPKFSNEEEGAVERWEEELKQFLAGVESETNPFIFDTSVPSFFDIRHSVEVDYTG
jgi:hypothetical protein